MDLESLVTNKNVSTKGKIKTHENYCTVELELKGHLYGRICNLHM